MLMSIKESILALAGNGQLLLSIGVFCFILVREYDRLQKAEHSRGRTTFSDELLALQA